MRPTWNSVGRTVLIAVLCVLNVVSSSRGSAEDGDSKVAAVRQKYGMKDIIHDIEHLKEDLKTITDLQLEGKLTEDETVFYFFRMHDFDDNNKLDGWELLAAMKHMSDHGHNKDNAETGISETVAAVDALMMFDKNEDGFLEYAELRSSTEEP